MKAPIEYINARGYSLIETMVVVVIFSLVMLAVLEGSRYLYRTNSYAVGQAFALSSASKGVERMIKELRETAYADNGAFPLSSIAAHEIVFYTDSDHDESVERVRYFLQGNSLMRAEVQASGSPPAYVGTEDISMVSDYVRNQTQDVATFMYRDGSGAEITQYDAVAEVAFVTVRLIVNVDENRLPEEFTLASSAALRNLHNAP